MLLLAFLSGGGPSATMLDDVFRHVEPNRSLAISTCVLILAALRSSKIHAFIGGKGSRIRLRQLPESSAFIGVSRLPQ